MSVKPGEAQSHPHFDAVWARLNEAEVTIALHIMPFWYFDAISPAWGLNPDPAAWHMSAWQWMNIYGERPLVDTLSAFVFDNLFDRYPPEPQSAVRRAWSQLVAAHYGAHGQEPGNGAQRTLGWRETGSATVGDRQGVRPGSSIPRRRHPIHRGPARWRRPLSHAL